MTSSTDHNQSKQGIFPATIASIINSTRVVINRGAEHGIKKGQRMLVYSLSKEEIKDPNTGESLGYLEIYKGTGKIINIQEKMSIVESDKNKFDDELKKYFSSPSPFSLNRFFPNNLSINQVVPFENPEIGDLVKPI